MRTRYLLFSGLLLALIVGRSVQLPAVGQQDCSVPSARGGTSPAETATTIPTYPVRVTVNGIRFVIPRNYFDYPPRGCDTAQPAFLLRALLPNFDGYSVDTDREFRIGGGLGRVVSILVQNVIQSRTASGEPDLEGFLVIWARPAAQLNWSSDKVYGLETASYQRSVKWEIYLQREQQAVTHVMKCASGDSVRFPYCESISFFKGTQVVYYFDRARLADWKAIRDGVVSLLERFSRDGALN